jgi:hypothetical protein
MGYALVPVDCDQANIMSLSIFEAMMQHNIKSGKANRVVYEAYEDGVITPAEYEEIPPNYPGLDRVDYRRGSGST